MDGHLDDAQAACSNAGEGSPGIKGIWEIFSNESVQQDLAGSVSLGCFVTAAHLEAVNFRAASALAFHEAPL